MQKCRTLPKTRDTFVKGEKELTQLPDTPRDRIPGGKFSHRWPHCTAIERGQGRTSRRTGVRNISGDKRAQIAMWCFRREEFKTVLTKISLTSSIDYVFLAHSKKTCVDVCSWLAREGECLTAAVNIFIINEMVTKHLAFRQTLGL